MAQNYGTQKGFLGLLCRIDILVCGMTVLICGTIKNLDLYPNNLQLNDVFTLFISQNSNFAALKFCITLTVHQKSKTPLFSFQKTVFIFLCYLGFPLHQYAQTDTNQVLNFNFNNHQIKEAADKIVIKPE